MNHVFNVLVVAQCYFVRVRSMHLMESGYCL